MNKVKTGAIVKVGIDPLTEPAGPARIEANDEPVERA